MKKFLKLTALLLVFATVFGSFTSCANISYGLKADGKTYPVGPYAFYAQYYRDVFNQQTYAYYGKNINENYDMVLDQATGQTLHSYILELAETEYVYYIIARQKFEELGLTLSEDEKAEIEEVYKSNADSFGDEAEFLNFCMTLRVTEEDFKNIITKDYELEAIKNYYFGPGGEREIYDTSLLETFNQNYTRFKYVRISTTDDSGNKLTLDDQLEARTNADEVINKIKNENAKIEDLIPEYSADYKTLTGEETEQTAENYRINNEELVNDGIITDKNGVYNEVLYNYYGYTLDADVLSALAELEIGDVTSVEASDAYWIIQKYDVTEDTKYFEAKRDSLYEAAVTEPMAALLNQWKSEFSYDLNKAVVTKFDPKNLSGLFLKDEDLAAQYSGTGTSGLGQ